jgi:hypothetical protein
MCICIHERHGIDNNGTVYTAEERLALLLLLRLDHLLHDFSLLNQEGAEYAGFAHKNGNTEEEARGDSPHLDALSAARTTVCPAHSLLALGDGGVLAGSEGRDLDDRQLSFKTKGMGKVRRRTPGSPTPQSPHFGEEAIFLRWW